MSNQRQDSSDGWIKETTRRYTMVACFVSHIAITLPLSFLFPGPTYVAVVFKTYVDASSPSPNNVHVLVANHLIDKLLR